MSKRVLLFAALVLSAPAFATHNDISLGEPGYGGTGCPDGTVSVTLSPDQKALSLLFDQYQVEVGGETGKSFDRKSCNIAIPVHVPQGLSVSILKIDFRGFNHLPASATQSLHDQSKVAVAAFEGLPSIESARPRRKPRHVFAIPQSQHV